MMQNEQQLRKRVKTWVIVFIIGLVLSGVTAFPIETELSFFAAHVQSFPAFMQPWIMKIYMAVKITNQNYPYLSYGTDWLAFGHLVIATVFIGPLRDPVKNIWIIEFGMIACVMVFPLAFIAGPIRGIPVYWRFIDCCFGIFGIIPLYICYRDIKKLEQIVPSSYKNSI
ncbi:hypothetical protein SNE25_03375 [Mucilaginibacter sabulilitoris]|uniref:DUF1404 domain-containing protein n=1 Tax=Mucilaginibacter sabulilitoris TaxID=1173583 RepID=A0ABZ0TN16_9SPHI|nr:hypothetical protein [Mucilaginibacter sabulilitoris]WPU94562.1 hypothetical protein SNE25_03375 [Mucilaginibacter sabulilitoris]